MTDKNDEYRTMNFEIRNSTFGIRYSAKKCLVLIFAAVIIAIALRLPRLSMRPMHCDEAVHAIKFGQLLEDGVYTYDPNEYHGPTLNYLSLIPAKLASAQKLTEVTEFTLRIVPVFFGVLLVLLLLLLVDGLGCGAAAYAAILTAISPAMVFYSRYYIMEILLVFFTFGVIVCGYRFARSGGLIWAILAGMFAGLMHATKETSIIAFGSMILSLLLVLFLYRKKDRSVFVIKKPMRLVAGLVVAVVVSGLFYSAFLSNPAGILDSVRTYTTYLSRGGGNSIHVHPWYYYLKNLVFFKYGSGPVWTEGLIVLLALVGFVAAVRGKDLSGINLSLLRFLAFYTLIMTVAYSVIPYKTPWCMLSFLQGMILLAGVGTVVLVRMVRNVLPRAVIIIFLVIATAHLLWQSYLNNYKYYTDSRNPYVYAHPTTEIFDIVRKVREYASVYDNAQDMPIQVICPGSDYWPLPWYLRDFNNVAWWDKVKVDEPSAPLIITSDKTEGDLANKLYSRTPLEERQMYMYLLDEPYYIWLRPKTKLLGFVRKDLWDKYHYQQEEVIPVQTDSEE